VPPLPLFPLETVLFPGALLPLHIFEPRYRTLLADVVEGQHRFGLLPPGAEGEAPPAGVVGCVARVRAVQPLPDGRSNIVVSGETRFSLVQVLPSDKPYLLGEVTQLDDLPDVQVPSAQELAGLRSLAERYAAALSKINDIEQEPELIEDPGLLSFQVAALLEWDYPTKLHFLAIRSATERVTRLIHSIPTMLIELEARAMVHQRASRNGTGSH
jgi:Lon protease-like protein